MIIEIKGLPEGQKIKHINVDISFDEAGETTTVIKKDYHPSHQKSKTPVEGPIPEELQENPPLKTTGVNETIPVTCDTDDRPKKEVPKEMLEMSF